MVSACLFGCSTSLAGTNDVELVYVVGGTRDATLLSRVRTRLGAVGLSADVERVEPDRLRVRIDAERATHADAILRWRGGVTIHRLVPGEPPK